MDEESQKILDFLLAHCGDGRRAPQCRQHGAIATATMPTVIDWLFQHVGLRRTRERMRQLCEELNIPKRGVTGPPQSDGQQPQRPARSETELEAARERDRKRRRDMKRDKRRYKKYLADAKVRRERWLANKQNNDPEGYQRWLDGRAEKARETRKTAS